MLKFKVGDKVKVTGGKDKGREGEIARVYPKKRMVVIAGVNVYKKHVKKQLAADGKGGIYELPRPMNWSKVAHLDPKTGKVTRVGFEVNNGKKIRISKKSGLDLKASVVKKATTKTKKTNK